MSDLFGALPEATEATADLVTRLEARETPERAVADLVAARPWPMAYERAWEPCAGTGVLAGVLRRLGHKVIASDIHAWRGDYDFVADALAVETPPAPVVITNPPFSLAHELVRRWLEIGVQEVVLFHDLTWFAQVGPWALFDDHPPTHYCPLRRRVTCWRFDVPTGDRRGSTPQRFAFYRFVSGHAGPTRLCRIPKEETAP